MGSSQPACSNCTAIQADLGDVELSLKMKHPISCWGVSKLRNAQKLVSGVFLQVDVDNRHLLLSHGCTSATAESMRHLHGQQGRLKMTQ